MKNKWKKIIITIVLILVLLGTLIPVGMYLGSSDFRVWADKNILRKNVEENSLPIIDMNSNDNTNVYVYASSILTLENNELTIYNKSAKKVGTINVSITKPLFCSSGDYLLVADEGGTKVYLVYNDTIQWEKDVEGQIVAITVNKNGAAGVIVKGTAYKSVIIMYDITGNESFKTFLSTTSATNLAISDDNKYLSFIEINTTRATIASKVKTIDAEKALSNPSESIINTYDANADELLLKLKYKNDKLTVLADDGAYLYENGQKEKIVDVTNASFIDINLDGYVASIQDNNDGKTELQLRNVENQKVNTYLPTEVIKRIYCNENCVAIDYGNKLEFVNNMGWLIKSFSSTQNIKNIIVGKSVVAIVYRDKIEVLEI